MSSSPSPLSARVEGHLASFRARLADFKRDLQAAGFSSSQISSQLRNLRGALEKVEVAEGTIARQPASDPSPMRPLAEPATALPASEERLRHAQRLEALGRLAGDIAHSFNNLLAAIAFHVDLLAARQRDRADNESIDKHVDEIRRIGERATTLAGQLLAFSRRQATTSQTLDLNAAIAAMEPLLHHLIGGALELEVRLAADAGAIHFDLSQLEQILLNLLINARDAMPGGGRCTLETAVVEVGADGAPPAGRVAPGRYARLAVTDTGTGMDPAVQARIFEPYFTTKERGRGTGLGLSTISAIVRESGGEVRVESAEGEGSRFEVFLPAVLEKPQAARRRRARSWSRGRGSECILLVEDEESIRSAAREALEMQGYQVMTAARPSQARELVAAFAGTLHLLVTDIVLPEMDGGRLADQLRVRVPALKVLYISGYPEDSLEPRVRFTRASFLQKPFPPRKFLEAVRRVLDEP